MASVDQIAKEYAGRIRYASDKRWEAQRILDEVNNLVYAETNERINNTTKLKVLEALRNELVGHIPYGYSIIEKSDNESYIALVNHMIQLLKK